MVAPNSVPFLEADGIVKSFPGVRALDGVSVQFFPGEVVTLLGENGAGKSTLAKILGGVYRPDKGEIRIETKPVTISSVSRANQLGIAYIHQELNLADNLTIGANVFLGREATRGGIFGFLKDKEILNRTQYYLDQLGMKESPSTLVSDLTIGKQQLVEIAKALSMNARLIIMDEPTSSLSHHESEKLFEVIEQLKQSGVSIAYISHRLAEIERISDRVYVLRDGCFSGELKRSEIERDRMISLMVGREVSLFSQKRQTPTLGAKVLEVKDFETKKYPGKKVSFDVLAGETVGLAGLVGAGRTEFLEALFGVGGYLGGEVSISGRKMPVGGVKAAIRAGLALVPEDRKQHGLILDFSVMINTVLAGLDRYQTGGFQHTAKMAEVAEATIKRLNIKTPSSGQIAQLLSGGNQQKIVLGKWISLQPKVLLLDEPTRGIDVMAKSEVYRWMASVAAEGIAVVVVSSELQEILHIADRVLVMHEGRITGEVSGKDLTEENVMRLATGG